MAAACTTSCDLRDQRAFRGLADALLLDHAKGDFQPGAASLGSVTPCKTSAVDVQPLPLFRCQEAVILLFVEPEHRSAHKGSLSLRKRGRGAPPDSPFDKHRVAISLLTRFILSA